MDRLFGKELSNVLNQGASGRQRNYVKLHSRSSRGLNINDPIRQAQKKVNKSTASHNVSMRTQKNESISS